MKRLSEYTSKSGRFVDEARGAERADKEFMVKFEKNGGGVMVRSYMGKSPLDVESKARVDAKRMGAKVASVRLKEEVEELDELSKSTLASYAKKAMHSSRIKQKIAKDFEAGAQRARRPDMKAAAQELSKKYQAKSMKREVGVGKAIDRLAKEEFELTEEEILALDEAKNPLDHGWKSSKEPGVMTRQKVGEGGHREYKIKHAGQTVQFKVPFTQDKEHGLSHHLSKIDHEGIRKHLTKKHGAAGRNSSTLFGASHSDIVSGAKEWMTKNSVKKEEVELDEARVDRGLSDEDKVAARAARGYDGRPVNPGNTSGGTFRGKGPSPYKDAYVAKQGPRKGKITQMAIDRTKDKIKSRLNKEEVEELDELSKSTLGRYVQKRVKQIPGIEVNYQMAPDEGGPFGAKRIKKFQKKVNKGVTGALNRLSGIDVTKKPAKTNEEAELEEGYEKTVLNFLDKRGFNSADFRDGNLYVSKSEFAGVKKALQRATGFNAKDLRVIAEEQIDEISLKDRLAGKTAPVVKSKYNRSKANRPMTNKELQALNRANKLDLDKMPVPDHAKDYTIKHTGSYEVEGELEDAIDYSFDILYKGKKVGEHYFYGYWGNGRTKMHGHPEQETRYLGTTQHLQNWLKTKSGFKGVFGKEGEKKYDEYVAKHGIKKYATEEIELEESKSKESKDTQKQKPLTPAEKKDLSKISGIMAKQRKQLSRLREEEELTESHFEVGDEVVCKKSGMEGEVVKIDEPQVGKYYTVKREDGKMMKYAPDELEAEDEDEDEMEESDMSWAKSKEMEKEKRLNPSDRDKLAKIRQMISREKSMKKESFKNPGLEKLAADKKRQQPSYTNPGLEKLAADKKKMKEELVGNQHKIDANKDGKITSHDFKQLRKSKKETATMNPSLDKKVSSEQKESTIRQRLLSVLEKKDPHTAGATPPEPWNNKYTGGGAKKMRQDHEPVIPKGGDESSLDKENFGNMASSAKKSPMRPNDNAQGDKNIINPVDDITKKASKKEDDGFKQGSAPKLANESMMDKVLAYLRK